MPFVCSHLNKGTDGGGSLASSAGVEASVRAVRVLVVRLEGVHLKGSPELELCAMEASDFCNDW